MFLRVTKGVLIAITIASSLVLVILFPSSLERYLEINALLLIIDFVLLLTIVKMSKLLITSHPKTMGFSLKGWIMKKIGEKNKSGGTNISLMGTSDKYFGIVMCLVLMAGLPFMATIEEIIFRHGTENWVDGFLRSLLFGLIHIFTGARLGVALSSVILGMFFTHMYFLGGLDLSTQAHFQYNLIILVSQLFWVTKKSFWGNA
jgi:hypothetical protein